MDVVTVTFDPCIDNTYWVNEFNEPPLKHEAQTGGKGVNVARVLNNLGVSCVALCPLGGDTGEAFLKLAKNENVPVDYIKIQNPTRVIDTFVKTSDYTQRVDYRKGKPLTDNELNAFEELIFKNLIGAKVLTINGAIRGENALMRMPSIIKKAQNMGITVIADMNGDALNTVTKALPDMITPNEDELCFLTGSKDPTSANSLIKKGLRYVLVTMGDIGCCLVENGKETYCPAPKISTVNPVGSGDSFLAGFLFGMLNGFPMSKALRYANACGAANASMFPAARITHEHIGKIYVDEPDIPQGILPGIY